MTGPVAPVWLSVADVKDQLRIAGGDTTDDALITRCAAAVEPQVQRARPDQAGADGYAPDAEVYQAAVMLAARLVRRRNSPGGVETFGESVTYVSRMDPEIARALHTGPYARPGVG
jgi:hypothetical protein